MNLIEAAILRGPSGAIKPPQLHVVRAKGIGVVYEGNNRRDAGRAVRRWLKFGREVTFTIDGETHPIP